ncbi:MAG: ATP-binding cassette domain-containing protein, partial [Devosia sp.]
MSPLPETPVLSVRALATHSPTRTGLVKAVDGVSFDLHRGKTLCVVGESGSGKSITARSILQIVDRPGRIVSGTMVLNRPDGTSVDLAGLDPRGKPIRSVRGREIAMIFQEPMSSLSPIHKVGVQIGESLRIHFGTPPEERRRRVIELLRQVEIPDPERAIDRYTFEFSGGMRQRVMIAMALACNPSILIADEPTTALDVTTQAEILDLIKRLQAAHGMAVMFITHDMGVVAEIADEVLVMYRGRVMERGPAAQVFHAPQDPYTRMLIGSVVRLEQKAEARRDRPAPAATEPLLTVSNLSMVFGNGVKALDDVSLTVRPGETLGIVGESGSGKTTMGRCLLRVYEAQSGTIDLKLADGRHVDVRTADRHSLKAVRRQMRMIFQDPVGSLNPRKTVADIIAEPLRLAGVPRRERQ